MVGDMPLDAEQDVSGFYNTAGWVAEDGIYEDARRWEDTRACAAEYVSRCRLRVLDHIPACGERILDMASGPIQYPEYLEYSRNFGKRYCIDLSAKALEDAERRIGRHGVFIAGSFFDIRFDDHFFDCAISLHTIYHMDKDRQEEAVRELVRVTRPGKPVIIVYSNPRSLTRFAHPLLRLPRALPKLRRILKGEARSVPSEPSIYFYRHPIDWWTRFEDVAHVRMYPWRSLMTEFQKLMIPDNRLGTTLLAWLMSAEDRFPDFFVKHLDYPMIVLTKRG
jgi:SAM-dependent methyltransferase